MVRRWAGEMEVWPHRRDQQREHRANVDRCGHHANHTKYGNPISRLPKHHPRPPRDVARAFLCHLGGAHERMGSYYTFVLSDMLSEDFWHLYELFQISCFHPSHLPWWRTWNNIVQNMKYSLRGPRIIFRIFRYFYDALIQLQSDPLLLIPRNIHKSFIISILTE